MTATANSTSSTGEEADELIRFRAGKDLPRRYAWRI